MNHSLTIALGLLICSLGFKMIPLNDTQKESASLEDIVLDKSDDTPSQISTFMTFQENNAEEAMNFYVSLFENSEVLEVQKYEEGSPAPEGSIMFARFTLNGHQYMCSDSYIKHEWSFSPGISNFVTCKNEQELSNLFDALSKDGNVFMPPGNYGFSQKFSWVEDRFGISWQLNLD